MGVRAFGKSVARNALGAAALALAPFHARGGPVRVFYGGARAGDLGGPLVKVRLLASRFPEHRIGYSLLYQLSNSIYLPPFALRAINNRGVPIVLNQNGVFYPAWYPHGWERANALMAEAHGLATHVLYQSEFCRRTATRFLGSRSGESEILYNAVETQRFRPAQERARSGPLIVLLSGKIVAVAAYRLTSAIAGLAAARKGGLDAILHVAGSLEAVVEAQGRALAERLGVADAIRWLGPYTRAQAPAIYREAEVYLMTKHNDPCPNVVLEAMASGLPIVYSGSGGVPELVGEEAGVSVPVAESFEENIAPAPDALAHALAAAAARREAMGAAARARAVSRFDVSAWLDRHEALFRTLLAKGRA